MEVIYFCLMFDNFQEAVRQAYIFLKSNNKLHFDSEIPSTGILKKWCISIYKKGLSREDEQVFDLFFDRLDKNECLERLIKKTEPDKFRPLRNFISGATKSNPDEKLVKLLSVLIDFKPRPYHPSQWKNTEKPMYISTSPPVITNNKFSATKTELPKRNKFNWLSLFRFITINLLIGLAFYPKIKNCSCFIEQYYIAIECNENTNSSLVIDPEKSQITTLYPSTTDSITKHEKKKKWYWKANTEENKTPNFKPLYFTLSIKIEI